MFEIKQSMFEIKQSVFEIKQSMFVIKQSILEIKQSMLEIKQSMFEIEQSMFEIKECILEIKESMLEIKQSMFETKQCDNMRIFLSLRFYVKSILATTPKSETHIASPIVKVAIFDVFDLPNLISRKTWLWRKFLNFHIVLWFHKVQITGFFCHSNVMWNQVWWI